VQIFIYESITAGGTYLGPWESPGGSLLSEGLAMLSAISADFAQVSGIDLVGMWDRRLATPRPRQLNLRQVDSAAEHQQVFTELASHSQAVLLIAPETEQLLTRVCQRAEAAGAKLLSPDTRFIELASDKVRLAKLWRQAAVPTPRTWSADCFELSLPRPAAWVVKPRDGAGSQDVHWLPSHGLEPWLSNWPQPRQTVCVQEYVPGRAASVSALGGPAGWLLLRPCWQHVAPPDFSYRGGAVIQEPSLIDRAQRIAHQALAALPTTQGMIGIDLVLGTDADSPCDYVIEVNPRLTTSYVGLRRACRQNLAHVMLAWTAGQVVELSYDQRPIQFGSTGQIIESDEGVHSTTWVG